MISKIKNSCRYSFKDLAFQAKETQILDFLYKTHQEERNQIVKKLCRKVDWYWEDRIGSDGKIYTAFSPERN
jgi:hypothetical protein